MEYRSFVIPGPTDRLKNFARGALARQTDLQFPELANILNRDDRLRGECFNQLDLIVGIRPNLIPRQHQASDCAAIYLKRNKQIATAPMNIDD
nr:hypothetical protein [Ruegeria denitrificans]